MDSGLSRIVKWYRDRIQRNAGSVSIDSAGNMIVSTGGSNRFTVSAGGTVTSNGNHVVTGTLTVSGTGTHSFSGPVKVARADGDTGLFRSDILHASNASGILSAWRQGNRRFRLYHENTDDIRFDVVGGTGDGQSVTEALRIVNANGYVSVATRLGVGTASPGQSLHVVGQGYFTGLVTATQALVGSAAGLFQHTATGATAPVLIVKGGATPGVGGDLAQFQNSGGTALLTIDKDGLLKWLAANTQTTVGASGAAAALPASPTKYLQVRDPAGGLLVIPAYAAA